MTNFVWGTFHNVTLEHWNVTFMNTQKSSKIFNWNFLKCSWTLKKFRNIFVNNSNQKLFWKNVPEQAISYVHHVLKKSKIAQFNRPANRDSLLIKRVISCRANAERGRLPPARVRLPHTEGKRNTSMVSMRR